MNPTTLLAVTVFSWLVFLAAALLAAALSWAHGWLERRRDRKATPPPLDDDEAFGQWIGRGWGEGR